MKNNFNLDDLEQFLSESTEQHRMYPSDRVWRNIDQEINGRKKWPALTFGAILTGAVITAGLILIHPDKSLLTTPVDLSTNQTKAVTLSNKNNDPGIQHDPATVAFNHPETNETIAVPFASGSHQAIANSSSIPSSTSTIDEEPSPANAETVDHLDNEPENGSVAKESFPAAELNFLTDRVRMNQSVYSSGLAFEGSKNIDALSPTSFNSGAIKPFVSGNLVEQSKPVEVGNIAKSSSDKSKLNRWSFTVYATPSISYRYLGEEKTNDLHFQNGPIAPNLTHGVNNFVNQTTLPGYELGGGIVYNLSKSIRVKTGLQFNLRGYKIHAFAARQETSTILLDRGSYTDSLYTVSTIGTQEGYMPKEVNNRYFEISVPIGIDMAVANWKKIKVYVGAGVQPTYQFNGSMYMISSDYKRYVQQPDLARHWNINTSLEAYVSYETGGVTWQLGPQIRYQVLPGAVNQYPVRERLIDYGLKLGVVKSLK